MSRYIAKYGHRALAVAVLVAWVLIVVSTVGKAGSGAVITWADAARVVWVVAAPLWIGWQAGRESKGATGAGGSHE